MKNGVNEGVLGFLNGGEMPEVVKQNLARVKNWQFGSNDLSNSFDITRWTRTLIPSGVLRCYQGYWKQSDEYSIDKICKLSLVNRDV